MNCRWIWIALVVLGLVVGCSDDPGTTPTENADAGVQDDASDSNDDDPDAASNDDAQDAGDEQCTSNADCTADDEYCDRPAGCDETGTCEPIPDGAACGEAETPYCDCSGEPQVSPTTCVWAPYDHLGECEDDGGQPDPLQCETNSDCPDEDTFCDRPAGCDELGSCEPIPDDVACGDAETPYCDCRGVTRVSMDTCIWEPYDYQGECEDDPDPPQDCETNEDCPDDGTYCNRSPGCEEPGVCEPIPDDEVCMDVVTPYCDCNGETQQSPNSCIYDAYEHEGACEDDEDDNGDDEQEDSEECELNEDCPESGTYCDREPGCDEPGTCEPIPDDVGCAQVITTYCDCQGHTQQSSDACIWEPYEHQGACEEEE